MAYRRLKNGLRKAKSLLAGPGRTPAGAAMSDASRTSAANAGSLLHLHPAHEVPLAQGDAVGAQDVVGGGGVEIEVWKRERHQKALRREGQFVLAEVKDDVAATERIDGVRRPRRQ